MNFLADENFDNDVLRGVERRVPDIRVTRVQDIEIAGADDPQVLAYAAEHGLIILTHDVSTMRGYFYERVAADLPVPGLFLIHKRTAIGRVVEALATIILASEPEEWLGKVTYVP